jgi:hypothetical protein
MSVFNSLQGPANNGSMGDEVPAVSEPMMAKPAAMSARRPAVKLGQPKSKLSTMGKAAPKMGMGLLGKTKKAGLGPSMRNKNGGPGNTEVISTLKSLGDTIMGRLDEIKKLIAQGGVANTSATLAAAAPAEMPMAPNSVNGAADMIGGRRRRATKRRGHKRR